MSQQYRRRKRFERFLLPRERKEFACSSKRRFSSHEEAALCQPKQRPYLCRECGSWHLSSEARRA